jgi:hypothetical protein
MILMERAASAGNIENTYAILGRNYESKGPLGITVLQWKDSVNIDLKGIVCETIPGGSIIFRTCVDRLWGPPSFLQSGLNISFTGVKRPGRGVDHGPRLSPRLKEEYRYSCTPLLGPHGLF